MRCVCWMNNRQTLLRAAWILYAGLMLWLLFGQRWEGSFALADWQHMRENIRLTPWHTNRNYLWVLQNSEDPGMRRAAVINLVGNVVMFVPMGYLMAAVFPKLRSFWRLLLWSVLLICAVELLQLVTGLGVCDIDDLLLNLPGVLLGWIFWLLLSKK